MCFSFLEGVVTDHRNVVLQAVKYRYAQEKFCGVSELKVSDPRLH